MMLPQVPSRRSGLSQSGREYWFKASAAVKPLIRGRKSCPFKTEFRLNCLHTPYDTLLQPIYSITAPTCVWYKCYWDIVICPRHKFIPMSHKCVCNNYMPAITQGLKVLIIHNLRLFLARRLRSITESCTFFAMLGALFL